MTDATFKIDGNLLTIGEAQVEVAQTIREVVEVNGILVVLLSWPTDGSCPQNVLGVSKSGEVLWQIPNVEPNLNNNPYVSLFVRDESILANRWDGLHLLLDAQSGRILKQEGWKA